MSGRKATQRNERNSSGSHSGGGGGEDGRRVEQRRERGPGDGNRTLHREKAYLALFQLFTEFRLRLHSNVCSSSPHSPLFPFFQIFLISVISVTSRIFNSVRLSVSRSVPIDNRVVYGTGQDRIG